jgi:CheY-like chemotaxis protein
MNEDRVRVLLVEDSPSDAQLLCESLEDYPLQKFEIERAERLEEAIALLAEILHDDLQQILAAAKFHLGLVKNRANHGPSLQAAVAQIDQMLRDAIEKSRSLSHELSPAVLHQEDLAESLRWLAGQVQAKHGLLVHVQAHGRVLTQSDALRAFLYKAAQELLFNVVKHARVHEATIRVWRGGGWIHLSVSDRARGFDPQGLKEARGFGLFSIRERVELLGGRMKIRSAEGRGSTFLMAVPDGESARTGVAAEAMPTARAKENGGAKNPDGDRLRVLLADDHAIVREGLILLLSEESGVEVVGQASNGREAVDLADRLEPDVIIMDVSMPLIDGDEATRQIKKHLPNTRVVALSMFEEPDTIRRMHAAGAEAYILKTAPSEDLLAAIRGHPTNTTS